MSDLGDPLDRIRALAPVPSDPDTHIAVLRRVFREGVSRRKGNLYRRLRLGGVAAGVVVLGAVTVAAAAGVAPSDAWQLVTGSPKDLVREPMAPNGRLSPADGKQYQPDLSTARKVFTIPGPDGSEFAGWTIENYLGWQCVSAFFEPRGTTTLSLARFQSSASSCDESPDHDETKLLSDGTSGSTMGFNDHITLVYTAGDAARADLVVSDGRRYPLPIQHGWFGGWFTQAQVPLGTSANIVAYDATGKILHTFDVLDQAGCPKHQLC